MGWAERAGLLHGRHPASGSASGEVRHSLERGRLRFASLCKFFPKSLLGGVLKRALSSAKH